MNQLNQLIEQEGEHINKTYQENLINIIDIINKQSNYNPYNKHIKVKKQYVENYFGDIIRILRKYYMADISFENNREGVILVFKDIPDTKIKINRINRIIKLKLQQIKQQTDITINNYTLKSIEATGRKKTMIENEIQKIEVVYNKTIADLKIKEKTQLSSLEEEYVHLSDLLTTYAATII